MPTICLYMPDKQEVHFLTSSPLLLFVNTIASEDRVDDVVNDLPHGCFDAVRQCY